MLNWWQNEESCTNYLTQIKINTYLENNQGLSNDVHRHIGPSLGHKCHALSIRVNIDRPVGQCCHNLHPASQLCSSTDRKHMYRGRNTTDRGNHLKEIATKNQHKWLVVLGEQFRILRQQANVWTVQTGKIIVWLISF